MKKIKKWMIVVAAILIILVNIIGFKWVEFKEKGSIKIVLIPKSVSSDFEFWQTVMQGAELAAKEENAILEVKGALLEKDIETQKQALKEAIDEKADVIIIAAADTKALIELIEEAQAKKITVLTVDSKTEGIENIQHVATNNIEAARALTQYMASAIEEGGEVAMVSFVEGTGTAKEREQGYKEEMQRHPFLKMHPTVYCEGTVQGSYKVTKELLKKYPNLKGIIGANQQSTDGICDAVQELGLTGKIKVVGFDSSNTIIYALEKDVIDAIIVQKPFNMGYLAVKNGLEVYRGKKIPEFIDTGYKFIDKETLYLIENQKLLYPIIK
ncbi:hypothetical protein CS063_01235 [Sporanaerobium hydrogeniformans]|uniref:Uncharacterized protein n=1 Tax=Sporanaerobium hydrogeniformans TaxID=3072179 RepID=A0AC61DHN5_9FIRM|nr:substrate-binding domain-containing protein [Sporanaerobium hydrogeniformans]PHV72131.1 hypothetical protein CS063_01235 [Sporanaerobium hydrogeniformans]